MNDRSPNHQQPESSLPIWVKLLVIILLSAISTGLVMTVRGQGWLQIAELKSFDLLMKLKGSWMELTGKDEPPDSRILIVTIDDEDNKYLERFDDQRGSLSLPDDALTKLLDRLDRLNKQKPLIIGSDIYRKGNFKAPLAERLKNDYRFFVICQVPSRDIAAIPPPRNIPPESWGFSNVLVDKDGIVRRHFLARSHPPFSSCNTGRSFNFLIAAHYLGDQGIDITRTKEQELQLGEVPLRSLTPYSGGYQGIDARGDQILLNYRYNCSLRGVCSLKNVALHVPLRHVLEYGIHPDTARQLKDSLIILIGVTARRNPEITPDFFKTPYGEEIPGVFLQAQMLSQILSAAPPDGRSLIGWWSISSERLWVLGWSLLGGIVGAWVKKLKYLVPAALVAIGVPSAISVVIFVMRSEWVPLIPAVLATILTLLLINIGPIPLIVAFGKGLIRAIKNIIDVNPILSGLREMIDEIINRINQRDDDRSK